MTYRNITVGGKPFKYVIGKSHTKIPGVGVFPNTDIGSLKDIPELCECCGTPMSELYPTTHVDRQVMTVTPKDVARKITASFPKTAEDTFQALIGAK